MNQKLESHAEMKQRHSDEFGKIEGIFFAFGNKQFVEGMAKVGLEPNDTGKILSLGAGGYILKDKAQDLTDLFARHKVERSQRLKDSKALLESLVYELNNHEFCISDDPTDALDALGLSVEDVDQELLNKAMRMCS